MQEPDAPLDALARAVIGAAIEVHRELGPGFLETVYEHALAWELAARAVPFERQACVPVRYKGQLVGEARVDLLVGRRLVVELKAVDAIHAVHRAQLRSYLRAVGTPLGLLLNFKAVTMRAGIERIVDSD